MIENKSTKNKNIMTVLFITAIVIVLSVCFYATAAWFTVDKSMGSVVVIGGMKVEVLGNPTIGGSTNVVLNDIGFEMDSRNIFAGMTVNQTFAVKNADKVGGKPFSCKVKLTASVNGVQNDALVTSIASSEWTLTDGWYNSNVNIVADSTRAFCTTYKFSSEATKLKPGSIIKLYFVVEAVG